METVKTIAVLAVLLVVGYLGYQAVTKPPTAPAPAEETADWTGGGNLDIAVPQVPMEVAGQFGKNAADSTPTVPAVALAGTSGAAERTASPGGDSEFLTAEPRSQVGSFTAIQPSSVATWDATRGSGAISSATQQAGFTPSQSPGSSAFPNSSLEPQSPPAPADTTLVRREFVEFLETARQKLDKGELANVHQVLSAWFADNRLTPQEDMQLTELLDQVAGTVVYSRQAVLDPPYTVEPGATLERIAERYGVPWRLLAKINGIAQPEQLAPGQSLKVIRGPFEARIYLSRSELVLFVRDYYAGRFPLTVGSDASTAPGIYRVCEKFESPSYYTPTGVISPGDPNNPLGRLWIGLGGRLGIHGPGQPDLTGQPNPPGAFILSEKDIEDVYDILSVGSQITIIP